MTLHPPACPCETCRAERKALERLVPCEVCGRPSTPARNSDRYGAGVRCAKHALKTRGNKKWSP